jgi:hypothetical protein
MRGVPSPGCTHCAQPETKTTASGVAGAEKLKTRMTLQWGQQRSHADTLAPEGELSPN